MGGKLIRVEFGKANTSGTDRSVRLEQLARASANLLLGGVNGDVDYIEDNTDFLAGIAAGFDPPLTQEEVNATFNRAIAISKQIHKTNEAAEKI